MKVGYTLKRSTLARTLRLSIYSDGAVVVSAPTFFGLVAIERFVAKHSQWIRSKVEETKDKTVVRIRRGDISTLKKRALIFAHERCQYFNRVYGYRYRRISIRAQKTRWGSCSRNGNLSFNYKIAVLPPELADYIIVHELCHFGEMNHSKKFWALVARTMSDHKALRKELRNIATVFY